MFVKFPAAMQVILNASAGGTLVLRTYALYACQKWILVLLLPVIILEAVVESWALTMGVPAELPPGIVGCILTGNPADGRRYAIFWVGQLIFPTLVFGMTVGRIAFLRREGLSKGSIMDVLLRDGVIYFAVIFVANLVNVVTFMTASQSIQQINAPFSEMITTVMICRLILNLRSEGQMDNAQELSEFRCATGKGASEGANAVSGFGSPRFFNSQPGTVSSTSEETSYDWGMGFESASVEEGRIGKYIGS